MLDVAVVVDYLSFDRFETHAWKQNDEDGDDGCRTHPSSCCGVVGFTVVAEQFAGGKEIDRPENFICKG